MSSWYAIYTNPRAEKKVAILLQQKGIETYLPLVTTLKQWSDRKKKVTEPIFKSYLFVNIDYSKDYTHVLNIPGVVKFIKIGGELTPIRVSVIEAIKFSLSNFDEITICENTIDINQPVIIQSGPLKGLEGTILKKQSASYFLLTIEQLGTTIQAKLPAAYIANK